jgi:predicted cupin superfamily sugar epimerase
MNVVPEKQMIICLDILPSMNVSDIRSARRNSSSHFSFCLIGFTIQPGFRLTDFPARELDLSEAGLILVNQQAGN